MRRLWSFRPNLLRFGIGIFWLWVGVLVKSYGNNLLDCGGFLWIGCILCVQLGVGVCSDLGT